MIRLLYAESVRVDNPTCNYMATARLKIRHLLEPLTGKGLCVHPQQELFDFVCLFALLIAACIGRICYFNPENQIDTLKH